MKTKDKNVIRCFYEGQDRMYSGMPPATETFGYGDVRTRIIAQKASWEIGWNIECGYLRGTNCSFPEVVFTHFIPSHAINDAVRSMQDAARWVNSHQDRRGIKRLFFLR
jgi:hypothetical protein